MDTLTNWSRLHPSFRLLITTRDDRITPALRNACHLIVLQTGDLVNSEANSSTQTFFQQRFSDITASYPSLPPIWPEMTIIKQLTDHAAGLFIWAEIVMRYLTQLNLILYGGFRERGDTIDGPYRQILRSFQTSKNHISDTLKRVVGTIALAKSPLYRGDLKSGKKRMMNQLTSFSINFHLLF